MNLVKTILRIDFFEATRPWLEIRDILRAAGGGPEAEIQAAPLVLDQKAERRRVVVQVRGTSIEQEAPASAEQCAEFAVETMGRLNEASPFPKIRRVQFESIFIEPYSMPFHELVNFLKTRFLRANPFVDVATDVGLVFDQHEDNVTKHLQLGPMDSEQLRSEYLRWPSDSIPDTFIFLAVAYESTEEVEFATNALQQFLMAAIAWEMRHVETVLEYLRREGD